MTRLLQVAVPNHLGDAVMALPFLHRLSAALPQHELRLVGRPLPALVLDGQGPWRPVSSSWQESPGGAALLLAPSFRVAWQARLSRCALRLGTPTDWRGLLLTHVVDASIRDQHQQDIYRIAVDRMIELLEPELIPEEPAALVSGGEGEEDLEPSFEVDSSGRSWWESAGRPQLLLHPWASGSPAKRWPLERWVQLGRRFPSVAVSGGPQGEDAATAARLAALLEVPCAAGETALSPRAWASLAQAVDQVVLPDTGLAHLASTVGVPAIVLFGATNPERYAPRAARVVAGESMAEISVERVAEELGSLHHARSAGGLETSS